MRALIQRVSEGSVTVGECVVGSIGPGLVVLVGISRDDDEEDARYLVGKTVNLRIFNDAEGRFNLSALDTGADLLLVSQFTLYADTRRGRRPGFTGAAPPETAGPLFEHTSRCSGRRASRRGRPLPGAHGRQPPQRRPGHHHARLSDRDRPRRP